MTENTLLKALEQLSQTEAHLDARRKELLQELADARKTARAEFGEALEMFRKESKISRRKLSLDTGINYGVLRSMERPSDVSYGINTYLKHVPEYLLSVEALAAGDPQPEEAR